MESAEKGLLKMTEKLESETLAKIKFTPACVIDLDRLLCDTYVNHCPKLVDYHKRIDLVRIINLMTKEIYGNGDNSPVVEGYGSFVMDMFSEKSDLDLSISFNNSMEVSQKKKIETLRKFKKKLYSLQRKGHVTGLQPVLTARVPIIKFTDRGTGIECDLSVDNRDGIAKSHIIRAISAIDERFRMLSFLMKSWAKAYSINSSKDRTLNSLSIVSFVAFHLQTRNPPILPPFSTLLIDGADPVSVTKIAKTYCNYGKQNKESLAELFITLFVKLASVEKLWEKGICASLYEGSWILKSWKCSYTISVEDFIDRSQNVARAVGTEEVKMIYGCIKKSLYYLSQFLNGQIQGIRLMELLFGTHTVSTLGVVGTSNFNENKNDLPTLQNPRPPKRMRLGEGLVENLVQKPGERNYFLQGLQGTEPQGMGHQALGDTVHNALASFTPSVSHRPPLSIPCTNIKVHHRYDPRAVPSPFALNSVAFERSYNPSVQSHLVSSQSSLGFAGTLHQKAVAPSPNPNPNPYRGPIHSHLPQVSHNLYREDYTTYNRRSN